MEEFLKCDLETQIKVVSDLVDVLMTRMYIHPVTFKTIWILNEENYDFSPSFATDKENPNYELIQQILKELNHKTILTTVFFDKYNHLRMSSSQTGNSDARGGGCGNLNLPKEDFQWSKRNTHGVTLADICEAIHRLKGSKYDFHYELFGGLELVSTDFGNINLKVSFCYGS